jgi:hypothetical protein
MLEIVPSSSIECDDGRTPELAAVYKDMLDNANEPDGVVVADGDGKVFARYFPSADTAADVNAMVPAAGEIVYKTDIGQAVVGDDAMYGGVPLNLNSQNCIFVSADGTPAKNGQSLADAVMAAGARTPYGNALSATNRCFVVIGPGIYDLTGLSANVDFPNFTGLIGLCGSEATSIVTSSSRRLRVISTSETDWYNVLSGITFRSVTPSNSFAITLTSSPNFLDLRHSDLDFPGLSSAESCMQIVGGTGLTDPTLRGTAVNCRTTGMGLYGGHTQTATSGNHQYQMRFERCVGGDRSFGGSNTTIGTRDGKITGAGNGLFDCQHIGTGASAWSCILDAPMVRCDWQPAIQRVNSGAYISSGRIGEAVSTFSINHNGAVNAKISHMRMAGGIGSNVTNLLTGGTLDNAGNFTDGDV